MDKVDENSKENSKKSPRKSVGSTKDEITIEEDKERLLDPSRLPPREAPEVTSKDRLKVLKTVLYVGGTFYLFVFAAIVAGSHPCIGWRPDSTEIAVLIASLGSVLTTIIGTIIGSSLSNKE